MTYCVTGLPMAPFAPFFALADEHLSALRAVRLRADADRGFPCRVSLEDARAGEELLLLHHVSHDVATPFHSSFAIYVRANAVETAPYVDCTPPVFDGRAFSLRGFDGAGMLCTARLALTGEADAAIRALFERDDIAYIHAHNAAHGCFAARIDRN